MTRSDELRRAANANLAKVLSGEARREREAMAALRRAGTSAKTQARAEAKAEREQRKRWRAEIRDLDKTIAYVRKNPGDWGLTADQVDGAVDELSYQQEKLLIKLHGPYTL